jgi:hypothetical protein
VWLLHGQIEAGRSDFSMFYTSGKIILSGHGTELYDLNLQREAQRFFPKSDRPGLLPYNHAPFEAVIFAPLALLRYSYAFLIWYVINVCLVITTLLLLRSQLPQLEAFYDLAFIGTSFFVPLLIAESQGQDSVLTLFLCVLSYIFLSRDNGWAAGSMLALLSYRPQLVFPMLIVILLRRPRGFVTGFTQTGLMLVLFSVSVVGWRSTLLYPLFLRQFVAGYRVDAMPNVRGLFYSVFHGSLPQDSLLFLVVVVSLVLLVMTAIVWRALQDERSVKMAFALLVTANVLVAFHAYWHDAALLLIPGLFCCDYLMCTGLTDRNKSVLAVLVAALFAQPLFQGDARLFAAIILMMFFSQWIELRKLRRVRVPNEQS